MFLISAIYGAQEKAGSTVILANLELYFWLKLHLMFQLIFFLNPHLS